MNIPEYEYTWIKIYLKQTKSNVSFFFFFLIDWIVFSQNLYAESVILNATGFRDKTFKEVVKAEWGHKGGTLIQ